VHWQ